MPGQGSGKDTCDPEAPTLCKLWEPRDGGAERWRDAAAAGEAAGQNVGP